MKYLLLLAALLFAGCATTPQKAAKKHNVTTVALEQRVQVPSMRYGEKVQGGLAPALASLIEDEIHAKGIARMATLMEQQNIEVDAMLKTNFLSEIQDLDFNFVESNPDAHFLISIEQFGFADYAFSSRKVPFVILTVRLQTRDGKVIWNGYSKFIDFHTPGLGAKWDEYEADPEKLRRDWEYVTTKAVSLLFKHARKDRKGSSSPSTRT